MALHKRWRGKRKLVLKLDRPLHRYLLDLPVFGDSAEEVAIFLIRDGLLSRFGKGVPPRDFSKKGAPQRDPVR